MNVESLRLLGAPPEDADLDFLAALLGDERVGRTLGGVRDRMQAADILALHRGHWAREGFGYWIWRERQTGEPVARGGLQRTMVEDELVYELGWAVLPERWGHGYATEVGRASAEVAARLGLEPVVAYTMPHNTASRRVMEKLGMRYDKTFVHGPYGPHVLYRATMRRSPAP
jgi:RimJ/RimL family protein N-acetyltransferase